MCEPDHNTYLHALRLIVEAITDEETAVAESHDRLGVDTGWFREIILLDCFGRKHREPEHHDRLRDCPVPVRLR